MKFSYISVLTTNDYLEGVLVLYYSLLKTQPKYPFLLLVTPTISEEVLGILSEHKINYKKVHFIDNPTESFKNIKLSRWHFTYSKLQIFGQTEFDKLVYLDSDMLVLQNIDELFEKPHMSAVNPSGILPEFSNCKQLNSGLMVIEPSLELYNEMMNKIGKVPVSKYGGDQDFLHAIFPDWPSKTELHLNPLYHLPCQYLDRYNQLFGYELYNGDNSIKIIHYWGNVKPWEMKEKIFKFESKMWVKKIITSIAKVKFKDELYYKSLIAWLDCYRDIPKRRNFSFQVLWDKLRQLINQKFLGLAS